MIGSAVGTAGSVVAAGSVVTAAPVVGSGEGVTTSSSGFLAFL